MVGRWFFGLVGTIMSIIPAFVYWLAGVLAITHNHPPSIGDIVAFTTLQSRLFFPLGQLLNVQVELQGALALFDRIFDYLDMKPEIVDVPDAVTLYKGPTNGTVRLRDVSFHYPSSVPVALMESEAPPQATQPVSGVEGERRGVPSVRDLRHARTQAPRPETADGQAVAETLAEAEPVVAAQPAEPGPAVPTGPRPFALRGIDFEARPGQLVALVGPSGSGKTTTTYLIPRLYDVDTGAVEIDGIDVRRIKLRSLGDFIGVVSQETYLFHSSIRDNLRYARPQASHVEIESSARAAAIHERIMELPEGYDTIVGERGYKLSGGEKQRVAIARVLLKDPRILILDEATSALDTVSERLIQQALEGLESGRTTIAVAHRLSTILKADLILVFDHGRIVERGTHDELLNLGGQYARLYREQFQAPPTKQRLAGTAPLPGPAGAS